MSDAPLPPSPTESASNALAEGARDAAKNAFLRRVRGYARDKLPRPIYDMIFRGMDAGEAAEAEVKRRLNNLLWGCGFSAVFGCAVVAVLVFVVAIIGWAVVFG